MKLLLARLSRRKLVILVLMLTLIGAGSALLVRPSPRPWAVIMAVPAGFPTPRRTLVDRCLAVVPMWAWRVKEALFAPATRILINATIIDLKGPEDPILSEVRRAGSSLTETNGQQLWLLDDADLNALRRRLSQAMDGQVRHSPRVDTADGVDCALTTSSTVVVDGVAREVGLTLGWQPRLRSGSTDLTTVILLTEAVTNKPSASPSPSGVAPAKLVSIRTNLATAAQMQIPDGSGIFLLGAASGMTDGHRMGVMISVAPKRQASGKK